MVTNKAGSGRLLLTDTGNKQFKAPDNYFAWYPDNYSKLGGVFPQIRCPL